MPAVLYNYNETFLCWNEVTNNSTNVSHTIFSDGANYDLFSACCSPDPDSNGLYANIYRQDSDCGAMAMCYTSDMNLATHWNSCITSVGDAAVAKLRKQNDSSVAGLSVTLTPVCEYINYARIQQSSAGNLGVKASWSVLGLAFGALLIVGL